MPAVPVAAAFLIAAGVAALVDWWAVAPVVGRVELWAKPLTMALLVGVAATAGDPAGDVRAWLVVGAVLGLVGDIALLGDGEAAFMVGLGAFALGHLAYAIAALLGRLRRGVGPRRRRVHGRRCSASGSRRAPCRGAAREVGRCWPAPSCSTPA